MIVFMTVCPACSKPFEPTRHWQRWCSTGCRYAAYLSGRPVLFLDIDGVLVTKASLSAARQTRERGAYASGTELAAQFDPGCVAELNRVLATARARIVLSSTWRTFKRWRRILAAGGVAPMRLATRTPDLSAPIGNSNLVAPGGTRADEIAMWLKAQEDAGHAVQRYAIVDDEEHDWSPEQATRLVQTTFEDGLTHEAADRLIEILSRR